MAIKIVPAHFRVRCPKCFLEFEYDAEDVKIGTSASYVTCPVCGKAVDHDPHNQIHVEEPKPEKEEPQGPVDPGNPYATW